MSAPLLDALRAAVGAGHVLTDGADEKLPPTLFDPEGMPGSGPFQGYFLFYGPAGMPADTKNPLNLAVLYTSKLIATPRTFYDPGLRHPEKIEVRFDFKYYQNAKYAWPKSDDLRENVRGNYMYYPQSQETAKKNPKPGEEFWSLVAQKTSQLVADR